MFEKNILLRNIIGLLALQVLIVVVNMYIIMPVSFNFFATIILPYGLDFIAFLSYVLLYSAVLLLGLLITEIYFVKECKKLGRVV